MALSASPLRQNRPPSAPCPRSSPNWSSELGVDGLPPLAGLLDRLVDAIECPPQVFARYVGGKREHALHVVAVVFAQNRASGDVGNVAQWNLLAIGGGDRNVADFLK